MAARKIIDWEGIEKHIRAGLLSNCEIARQYGVTEGAIRKHIKEFDVQRDLSAKVREKVRIKLVREKVRKENATATEAEIIDHASNVLVAVVELHQKSLRDGHVIVDMLHAQLDAAVSQRAELQATIEAETAQDETVQRRNAMIKAISIPSHAGVMRDLSVALKNLIPLERQAFSLDEDGSGGLRDLISHLSPASKLLIAEALGVSEEGK